MAESWPERLSNILCQIALLAMVVLTPLWALIEWQDNGGFERFSNNSTPGDWDPWILTVGAVWAFAIVLLLLWDRRRRLER